MRTCPTCYQRIRDGLIYCTACGYKLIDTPFGSTTPVSTLQPSARILPSIPNDGDLSFRVWVCTAGGTQCIPLPARNTLTFGRYDPDTRNAPNVDLSPYNARDLGVSRLHAAVQHTLSAHTLMDLDSLNGTHLNGVRLKPFEVHVLRPDDAICLGRLVLYVRM
jgi:hypothetical protein